MWKLKFDDREVFCTLEKRPACHIEEKEVFNEDGTMCWVPGKMKWLPLKIKLPAGGTLWNKYRCKDIKLVMFDKERELEEWTLKRSRVTFAEDGDTIEITFSECNYKNKLAR